MRLAPTHAEENRIRLFSQAEQWFRRGRAAVLESVPCRRGCARCCVGLFAITIVDHAHLQRGLASLPSEVAQAIQQRAAQQMAQLKQRFPRLRETPFIDGWQVEELDTLAADQAELPCPALGQDGSCLVYDHRPLTCRMMGLPLDTDGIVHGACEVQSWVPIARLPTALRSEEEKIALEEGQQIAAEQAASHASGEEMLISSGFLALHGRP